MGRRKKCEGMTDHVWVRNEKKPDTEICQKCLEMFPCDYDCGHGDCIEKAGNAPFCAVCEKIITPNPDGSITLVIVEDWGDHWLPAHVSCKQDGAGIINLSFKDKYFNKDGIIVQKVKETT